MSKKIRFYLGDDEGQNIIERLENNEKIYKITITLLKPLKVEDLKVLFEHYTYIYKDNGVDNEKQTQSKPKKENK